jgi:hypothetical protein
MQLQRKVADPAFSTMQATARIENVRRDWSRSADDNWSAK